MTKPISYSTVTMIWCLP
ncbi:hypothetical protein Gotur_033671 [Gossypium turneri]